MESRSFDGHKVEQDLARLAGTFSVDANDAPYLLADQPIVAVVVARLSGETSQILKRTGIVRRTDVLEVSQFAVVHEPELQALLRAHLPQLEAPDVVPPALYLPVTEQPEEETPSWVPPSAVKATDNGLEVLTVVEPDEEEVQTLDGSERIPVGGSRKNDPVLARFMEDMTR